VIRDFSSGKIAIQYINNWFFCAVSSVVEHYLDTIKMPILAIFSCLYFPFAIIARPFISLNNYNVLMASLVISKNPEFFIWVTSRVQVLAVKRKITPFKF
jgi:hypothetical protein